MASHRVKNPRAYQYATDAHNFVKVGRYSRATRICRSAVENIRVEMIDVVSKKDIGNQFQK